MRTGRERVARLSIHQRLPLQTDVECCGLADMALHSAFGPRTWLHAGLPRRRTLLHICLRNTGWLGLQHINSLVLYAFSGHRSFRSH
jgi:hypothetical protein